MKKTRLSRCIGDVDDRYIDEAENFSHKRGFFAAKWPAAACFILALAAAVCFGAPLFAPEPDGRPATPSAEGAPPSAAGSALYIPALELPEADDGVALDMMGLVVYKGNVYTQAGQYTGAAAAAVENLVGERLGYATGRIDEWSGQEEYAVEFASTCAGDVCTVRGYGEDFRLCIVTEPEDEHGNPEKQIQFYERLNGIGVTTGEDLFGSRLHMRERWAEVRYLSHDAWNQGGTAGAARAPVGVSEEQFCDFIDVMYAAEFEYVYESTPDFYTDSSRAQAHLYVRMEDETVVELRLFEGGYVGYQHMGWYFVKMPGAAFDAVFAGCR